MLFQEDCKMWRFLRTDFLAWDQELFWIKNRSLREKGILIHTYCSWSFFVFVTFCSPKHGLSIYYLLLACGRSLSTFNPLEDLLLIQNGHISSRGDFPWIAALYNPLQSDDWHQICGGTLISPNLVLTGNSLLPSLPNK